MARHRKRACLPWLNGRSPLNLNIMGASEQYDTSVSETVDRTVLMSFAFQLHSPSLTPEWKAATSSLSSPKATAHATECDPCCCTSCACSSLFSCSCCRSFQSHVSHHSLQQCTTHAASRRCSAHVCSYQKIMLLNDTSPRYLRFRHASRFARGEGCSEIEPKYRVEASSRLVSYNISTVCHTC